MSWTVRIPFLALIFACALPLAAQGEAWPQWFADFQQAAPESSERDQLFQEHWHDGTIVWNLVRKAAARKALEADGALPAAAFSAVARDFAGRLDARLSAPLFLPDWERWVALDKAKRLEVAAALIEADASYHTWGSQGRRPSDWARVRAALAPLVDLTEKLDDPTLRRTLAFHRLRMASQEATDRAAFNRAHTDCIDVYVDQGLDGQTDAVQLRLVVARRALTDGDWDAMADQLDALRDQSIREQAHLIHTARFVSLSLELGRVQGDSAALYALAHEFRADLLPRLRAWAQTPGGRWASSDVASFESQAAQGLMRFGAHDRALEILAAARSAEGLSSLNQVTMALLAAQAHEALGEALRARDEAGAALRALRDAKADDPDLSPALRHLLGWQAVAFETTASVLLGELAEATAGRERGRQFAEAWAGVAKSDPTALQLAPDAARMQGRQALADGLVCDFSGDLDGALAAFRRADAALSGMPGVVERTQIAWSQAHVLLRLGDVEGALEHSRKARRRAAQAQDDQGWLAAASAVAQAELQMRAGRQLEARVVLQESLAALGEQVADARPGLAAELRRLLAEALTHRTANTTTSQADSRRAHQLLNGSLATLRGHIDRPQAGPKVVAEYLRALALSARLQRRDRPSEAKTITTDSLELGRNAFGAHGPSDAVDHDGWGECRALLHALEADAALVAKRPRRALRALTAALADENWQRRDHRYHASDGLVHRTHGIARQALELSLSIASKSRSSLDAGRALALQERLAARGTRELVRAAIQERAFRIDQAATAGTAGARFATAGPLELQRLLSDGRAALSFAVYPDRLYAVLAREGTVRVRAIDVSRERLAALVMGLSRALDGAPDAFRWRTVCETGHELHSLLLRPWADELATVSDLIVVPDGPLHGLPFAALVTNETLPQDPAEVTFLPQSSLRSLSLAPSLSILTSMSKEERSPLSAALLIGSSSALGEQWPALPFAKAEVERVATALGGPEVVQLTGDAATSRALAAEKLGRFGILHLATHARNDRDPRAIPALLLRSSEDDPAPTTLGPVEAARLDLSSTQLVVLSACSSGLGTALGFEGSLGLPRAFLIAGARSVVAATQRISDRRTAPFMSAFYARLGAQDAASPARALWHAQASAAASTTARWPGGWAPFFLVGAPGR